MIDLGGRIRAERMRRDMTQQALADAVGLHHSEISRIERGTRRLSIGVLGHSAAVPGLRPEDLMSDVAV